MNKKYYTIYEDERYPFYGLFEVHKLNNYDRYVLLSDKDYEDIQKVTQAHEDLQEKLEEMYVKNSIRLSDINNENNN